MPSRSGTEALGPFVQNHFRSREERSRKQRVESGRKSEQAGARQTICAVDGILRNPAKRPSQTCPLTLPTFKKRREIFMQTNGACSKSTIAVMFDCTSRRRTMFRGKKRHAHFAGENCDVWGKVTYRLRCSLPMAKKSKKPLTAAPGGGRRDNAVASVGSPD